MSTIQLNPEQQAALDADGMVRAVDPRTNESYVLVPEQEFLRTHSDTARSNGVTDLREGGLQAAQQFREWVARNAVHSVVADDSRDTFYAGRGE
jgi:hypothetical protein